MKLDQLLGVVLLAGFTGSWVDLSDSALAGEDHADHTKLRSEPPTTFSMTEVLITVSTLPGGLCDDRYRLSINGDGDGRFAVCKVDRGWRQASFKLERSQVRSILAAFYDRYFFDFRESYCCSTVVTTRREGAVRDAVVEIDRLGIEPSGSTTIALTLGSYTKSVAFGTFGPGAVRDLVRIINDACESVEWTELPPDEFPRPEIAYRGRSSTFGYLLSIVNASAETLWYQGSGSGPTFALRKLVSGHWSDVGFAWCGNGIEDRLISPRDSLTFNVGPTGLADAPDSLRVGVGFRPSPFHQKTMVWGEAFDPSQ